MSTLSLPGKVKPDLRLVVDNPDFRPAVFRSHLGKMRDFTARCQLVKNEKYLTPLERKAIELADYVETGYVHQMQAQLDEPEARIHLVCPPSDELADAALKVLRERKFRATYARKLTSSGAHFTVSRAKKN